MEVVMKKLGSKEKIEGVEMKVADSKICSEIAGGEEERMMSDSALLPSNDPCNDASDHITQSDCEEELSVRVKETSLRAILVVVGIFGLNVIRSGTMRSFGLIIDDMVIQFDTGTEEVGLAIGLYNGFAFGLAPLIAPLTKRVSWMMTMMLGGSFVIGVTLSLSSISPNIMWFSVAMATAGISSAFVLTLTFIVFSEYFRKHFALAFGISDIGYAMVALMTLVAEKLVSDYGWRGSILIFAGLNFNSLVSCALMPDPRAKHIRKAKITAGSKDSKADHSRATVEDEEKTVRCARYKQGKTANDLKNDGSLSGTRTPGQAGSYIDGTRSPEGSVCMIGIVERQKLNEECDGCADDANAVKTIQKTNTISFKAKNTILRPFRWLWTVLDWSLCRDEPFLNFILVATLTLGVIESGFYIFLIPHATAKGITVSQAVTLAITTGVGDAIGNLCQGPIIDRSLMTSIGLFMLLAGINGCLFLLDPVIEGVVGLTFCSLCYGICNGGQMTVTLVVLKEATPPSRFHTAYGLSSIASGLAHIIGGFSAGWVVSSFGYELMYLYLGGVSIATVLLLIPAYYHYVLQTKQRICS